LANNFFWADFFFDYFHRFEISVKFCEFWILICHKRTKKFWGHWVHIWVYVRTSRMKIRKKWLNQLKNFFTKHFWEYYLASFWWWISSSCENHCTLVCTPPPPPLFVRGEDTLAVWRGGGGLIVGRRQTLRCTLYTVCKYFLVNSFPVRNTYQGEGGPRHSTLKQISYVPHNLLTKVTSKKKKRRSVNPILTLLLYMSEINILMLILYCYLKLRSASKHISSFPDAKFSLLTVLHIS
jgi:hypothetical protein